MRALRSGLSTRLLALVGAVVAASPLAAANWPQWRGPRGQGVSTERGLPVDWSPAAHVAWKTPIAGRGHSAPIVWGDRLFLTTAIEGAEVAGRQAPAHTDRGKLFLHPDSVGVDRRQTLKVLALDTASGRVL